MHVAAKIDYLIESKFTNVLIKLRIVVMKLLAVPLRSLISKTITNLSLGI